MTFHLWFLSCIATLSRYSRTWPPSRPLLIAANVGRLRMLSAPPPRSGASAFRCWHYTPRLAVSIIHYSDSERRRVIYSRFLISISMYAPGGKKFVLPRSEVRIIFFLSNLQSKGRSGVHSPPRNPIYRPHGPRMTGFFIGKAKILSWCWRDPQRTRGWSSALEFVCLGFLWFESSSTW